MIEAPPQSILLASSSPRRLSLLKQIGLMFETMSPDVDESLLAGEAPEEYVERLSKTKADAVPPMQQPSWTYLAIDVRREP